MVTAFVCRESRPGERRVAATPETVKGLVKTGLTVEVQSGAGEAAGFPDSQYEAAGAGVVGAERLAGADLVLGIAVPETMPERGTVLVCSMQPLLQLDEVRALADAGVTTLAMDLVPRITRAQKMDILSSQATAAGYKAVLLAAVHLPRFFPLLMTAAGTITPARVLVMGAGVAGLQAIATARRLGAVVEANDIRPAVKEQVESLGAKFVDTGTPPDAETKGGYAKETTAEFQRKQREILHAHVQGSDVVITTAMIPGRNAPVLVTADMVAAMKPGAVVVDLAVAAGGNVEGSRSGETVVTENGVTIIGEPNLPSLVAGDASRMFARNVLDFLGEIVADGALRIDRDEEIAGAMLVTHEGEVVHAATAEALAREGS